MRSSTISMAAFACYLTLLSLALLFWAALLLHLGYASVPTPWVPLLGSVVGVLAFFCAMAVRARATQF